MFLTVESLIKKLETLRPNKKIVVKNPQTGSVHFLIRVSNIMDKVVLEYDI